MRSGSRGLQRMVALAAVLLGLTACAKAAITADQDTALPAVQDTVQALLANQAAGRVGTVAGVGYVTAPIAVPLADGEVSLLPSTPDLEAALAPFQRRWWDGRRRPLPYEAFQAAFARLTRQRVAVGRAGGEGLIRFATTDDKGRFQFEGVPNGQWLLVADMSSPVSILLWTIPVEVGPADQPPLFLTEANLLLEARMEVKATPAHSTSPPR